MFEHKKIQDLNDFFIDLNNRREKGVYFYRVNGYNEQINEFIQKYYDLARRTGVIIEGKIPNPDEKNLSYYSEIMGMNFQLDLRFISVSLKKWLPRMKDIQRELVATSIYDSLDALHRSGKNENMLKNAYIKFMCWLYYKFERIVNQLGENKIPKILYEGEISNYELMLISILSNAGCDVVLLQYKGDQNYLKLDVKSLLSNPLNLTGMTAFPDTFNLKWIRTEIINKQNQERLYGILPQISNCTNAWIKGNGLEDSKTALKDRGNDPRFFYNCFYRIRGVEDKTTYLNELYQFQLEIKNQKRNLLILETTIPQPTIEEISSIRRSNYNRQDQMLMELSSNIQYTANIELQRIMVKAFLDLMLELAKQPNMNLNKLTNKAVYLICWLRRYQSKLFTNWKMPNISCFIYFGICKNENEALLMRYLARLPIDVLILNPDLTAKCCLEDRNLYEVHYVNSLAVHNFPIDNANICIGTAAYHAERELDTVLYQDSGLYRNQQYAKATTLILQTMYEEIAILWDQEVKYRPNFSIMNDIVTIPTIFAKVSGVKDGIISQYWSNIRTLVTEDTFVIKDVPYLSSTDENPVKPYQTEFLKHGRVQKNKIKSHKCYQYSLLREELQDYLLEQLQLFINRKIIKGTFENGTEYTIVSTVLNIKKEIFRMIQKFDFTKKNPKIIYINTTEKMISLEDTILMSYLNLIGFDVVFFIPTGYQTVEQYFNQKIMEEHQIGEYLYDLHIPNLSSSNIRQTWRDKIFKRGK